MRSILTLAIVSLLSIFMIACGEDDYSSGGVAYPRIRLLMAPGAQHAVITSVVLSVSGPDMELAEFDLNIDDDGKTASGTISVPSGKDRVFTVTVYSANGVESTGEQRVSVLEPGKEFLLEVQLKPAGNVPSDPIIPDVDTITGEDDVPMVLIPAGEFQMGDSFSEGSDVELPVHTVYLDAFYMDIYEVTNAQYQKFMDATGHATPRDWNDPGYNAPDHPVVGVSWHDAVAYAEWVGKRLPTEAEWEKAARGGLSGKRYPWGDEISHDDANYRGTGGKDRWDRASKVGSFAPNGCGLYDMAGNVYEWCSDWYDGDYYSSSPKNNPTGPSSGSYRILRGGSWFNSFNTYYLRCADRSYSKPTSTFSNFGFRCSE